LRPTPILTAAFLSLAALSLSACGKPTGAASSAGGDRFAGLDAEIKTWREGILASHKICAGKTGDMACQDFEVACKAERTITPAESKKGVAAKLVAAMTFNGKGTSPTDLKPGSAFAEFSRTGAVWTRSEAGPVNLSTCATF
jgi:hypothetical protein